MNREKLWSKANEKVAGQWRQERNLPVPAAVSGPWLEPKTSQTKAGTLASHTTCFSNSHEQDQIPVCSLTLVAGTVLATNTASIFHALHWHSGAGAGNGISTGNMELVDACVLH